MNQIIPVSTDACIVGPYSRAASLALQAAQQLYQEARRFEQVTIALVANVALVSKKSPPPAQSRAVGWRTGQPAPQPSLQAKVGSRGNRG